MLNLWIMSKDTPIARVIDDTLEPLLPKRLPLFLQRTGSVAAWLESRAIDAHRTNSRLLKRALRLENKDDLTAVLAVNAATITDNYWVKPLDDAQTCYADVRFQANAFDNLALTGDVNSFMQAPSRTPELTNTGSFEKCWRRMKGAWWMVKAGRPEELFSEFLAYQLGKALGLSIAEYAPNGQFIRSRDFTQGALVDFEPAIGVVASASDYVQVYEALCPLGEELAAQYVQMCYFDALILNMDRHEHNFGFLRDSETGQILQLAPLFDHNIALVARNYPNHIAAPNDLLLSDFATLSRHIATPVRIKTLSKKEIEVVVCSIPFPLPATEPVPEPLDFVAQMLWNRQAWLIEQK